MSQQLKRCRIDTGDGVVANKISKQGDGSKNSPTPPYLKMIADCWEHIYDKLSFRDILVMGQTCRRMNQMSGYYMREYYSELEYKLVGKEINFEEVDLIPEYYPYITRLYIDGDSSLDFFSTPKAFDSLKMLFFIDCKITTVDINNMEHMLNNIENIELIRCEIDDNIFEKLAKYCPKLRHLNYWNYGENVDLLRQYYPLLECLNYCPLTNSPQNDDLKNILEKHTLLKRFDIDFEFLWANREVLGRTNIHLGLMNICVLQSFPITVFEQFVAFMKSMYDRGCYEKLQLSFDIEDLNADDVDRFRNAISELPQLEKLLLNINQLYDLSRLTNLKELYVGTTYSDESLQVMAKSVQRLQRLAFFRADFNTILPFIRYSQRLKSIEIENLVIDTQVSYSNLIAFNQDRQKLENSTKMLIYLQDKDYVKVTELPHKFNYNFNLVKVARIGSFDF